MKKQLFTFLTLLLCVCSSAWGADADLTYTQPSATLDLQSATLSTTLSGISWSSRENNVKAGYSLTTDYLIFPLQTLGCTCPSWCVKENFNNQKGTWSASDPFPADTEFFSSTGSDKNNVIKVTTTRPVAVKVTNCTGAYVYGATGSNYSVLNVYEVTNSTDAYNTFTNVGTANTNSNAVVSVTGLTASKTYIIQVIGGTGSNATSYAIALKRAAATVPTISSQPSSATYENGDTPDNLSVTAAASAGDLSYQWYKNTDGDTSGKVGDKIDGATSATLGAANISTASVGVTYYYCIVTDNNGSTTSEKATITVVNIIAPLISYEGTTVTITCAGAGTVYYTTDNSEPTSESTAYTAPFDLTNSSTVRAVAKKGENYSEITFQKCYVDHSATALAVLGFEAGSQESGTWTSTDGKYSLTSSNSSDIQYSTVFSGQDGFKLNHTNTYTLTVSDQIKVTSIKFVGISRGDAVNNSTIAFEGFTPASGTIEMGTFVKTIEFTPTSELDYGSSINITTGGNQFGGYFEIYGTIKTYAITEGTHTNGTIGSATSPAQAGAEITLTATPSSGYEFTSWEILKTSDDSDVTDAVSLSSTTAATATFTMPAYGVTINAAFEAARYTVTYNVNGGGTCATASEKQATAGASLTLPTPTWSGYTFDGWYNNGTEIGDAGDSYTPTADITLYAKWTDNTEGKLFSYVDGNYGDKFQAFDASGWVTADATGKSKTFTDAITGAQFVVTDGAWDNKTNSISALAKFKKGSSAMSVVIPDGYQATVKILYGAYNTANKLIVNTAEQTAPSAAFNDSQSNATIHSNMTEVTLEGQSGTLTFDSPTSKNIYIGRVAVELTHVTGTISASGWNTFSSKYALDLSKVTDGTAYVASAAEGTTVTLTPVTDKIIAANAGLMIKGTADDEFAIEITTADATFSGTNKLVGLPNGGTVEKNNHNYVFGWATAAPESPGFYLINDTEPVLGAGKAYLHADADLSARLSIDFEDGETTGIESAGKPQTTTNREVYNLAGQRVAQPTKGLYIVNGRKVVIK